MTITERFKWEHSLRPGDRALHVDQFGEQEVELLDIDFGIIKESYARVRFVESPAFPAPEAWVNVANLKPISERQ